jgi:prevent-host-death family protein
MTVTVSVHEAKSQLSALLAKVSQEGESGVICNRGKPVADLCPHRTGRRTELHKHLSKVTLNYDPVEALQDDEWPESER